MTHTFHIHGMTCDGCRSHLEEILSKVEGLSMVTVDLKKGEATIKMGSQAFDKIKGDETEYIPYPAFNRK